MKRLVEKIAAITLVLMLLFATMSFTVRDHYCGDTFVRHFLFSPTDPCNTTMDTMCSKKG